MTNKVKFKIGEIEFETEGSPEVIERERSIFMNSILPAAVEAIVKTQPSTRTEIDSVQQVQLLPEHTQNTETNILTNKSVDFSRTSLASFIKSKGADAHYDFIVCAMYFEQNKSEQGSFSSKDIKSLYADAKKPIPGNLSMSLSELVKKGLIMEDPTEKGKKPIKYILTSNGEQSVEEMIPNNETKNKKSTAKSHKQKAKQKSKYLNINCDELNLNSYPTIKSLKSFKERMMLLLYIVTEENIGEYYSVADIQCLMTDIMGLHCTIDQINGIIKKNKTWFKKEPDPTNKRAYCYKLLQGAKDFVEGIIQNNN